MSAFSSSTSCCLCHGLLGNAKGSGKHKKLNGASSKTEREILSKYAAEFSCMEQIREILMRKDAIICYDCISKTVKAYKLDKQLNQLKEQIRCMIQSITFLGTANQLSQGDQNESSSTTADNSSHPSKWRKTSINLGDKDERSDVKVTEVSTYIKMP